jgi:hypothetical protein
MKINVKKRITSSVGDYTYYIEGIQIDIRSDKSMYITIGDYTYYIDDSTGEQVIDHWKTNSPCQRELHQVYDEWVSWADFLGINNK